MDTNFSAKKAAEELSAFGCAVKTGEPMKLHTSFKIGGDADLLITVRNTEQLLAALGYLRENGIPLLILGNGSNMLVSDKGIRGAAVKLSGEFLEVSCRKNDGILTAGAGASLSSLCVAAMENSLSGLEFAWGIPGSVGGAVYMNAGAYGGELKDAAVSVGFMTPEGEARELPAERCGFGYRSSVFQTNGCIITSLTISLSKGDKAEIKAKMDDIFERRRSKQPLEYPSAGSVFKRPEGHFAGGLIEQCGLKGCSVGGAQVSEKHAGFIINKGGATCADVLSLVKHIQKTVKKETGVDLEREIRVYGDS